MCEFTFDWDVVSIDELPEYAGGGDLVEEPSADAGSFELGWSEASVDDLPENSRGIVIDWDRLSTEYLPLWRSKLRTANQIVLVLVVALAASLVVHLLAICVAPEDATNSVAGVFDKWYSIIGPLIGTAFGFYFSSERAVSK